MTRKLFFLAKASGVACFGFSGGGAGFELLSARPRVPLLAIASGGGAGSDGPSAFLRAEPSSCAFNCIVDFFLIKLSLNSSRRTVGFGPPVWFNAFLPERMLVLSMSGAT
jgi:hypothetical protein